MFFFGQNQLDTNSFPGINQNRTSNKVIFTYGKYTLIYFFVYVLNIKLHKFTLYLYDLSSITSTLVQMHPLCIHFVITIIINPTFLYISELMFRYVFIFGDL